jgi:hypothetical protein
MKILGPWGHSAMLPQLIWIYEAEIKHTSVVCVCGGGGGFQHSKFQIAERNTSRHCLKLFCFNASCQFTPLLNLRSYVFGLTPFGCFLYVSSYGNIIFFIYAHFVWKKSRAESKALMYK